VDRDEYSQYFGLHQEAVRFLLVAEAAKTSSTCLLSKNRLHIVSVRLHRTQKSLEPVQ
jgi:hypothetical protein